MVLDNQILSLKNNGFFKLKTENLSKDILVIGNELGEIMGQYKGEQICEITPKKKFESLYYSQNRKKLYPHTEAYEFEYPPRYILLGCLKPDKFKKGLTSIADINPFLNKLDSETLDLIRNNKFLFKANSGLNTDGFNKSCYSPILDDKTLPNIFRYSYNNIYYNKDNKLIERFLNQVLEFYQQNKIDYYLKENELLVIDNYRILHGRSEIKDYSRKLLRVWVRR